MFAAALGVGRKVVGLARLMSEVLSIYVFNRLRLIVVNYHNYLEVIERIYTSLGRQVYAISFYLNPFKSQ